MKKIITISLIATLLIVAGCKKENLTPSKVVKASYPTMTLLGAPLLLLAQGAVFTDPGASWIDSLTGETGTVKATETLNTGEEGITVLNYTARNKNGYESTVSRTIAITGISDSFDISGSYLRTAGSDPIANITKIGKGLFQTDNLGGNSFYDPAVFMIKSDSTLVIPSQYLINSDAPADFVSVSITYTPNVTIKYAVISASYGTQVRTFNKQ